MFNKFNIKYRNTIKLKLPQNGMFEKAKNLSLCKQCCYEYGGSVIMLPNINPKMHDDMINFTDTCNVSPFVGLIPGSLLWGCNLGLCAVNLAEAAGESIPMTVLAEIYVSAALRVMSTKFKFAAVSILYTQKNN